MHRGWSKLIENGFFYNGEQLKRTSQTKTSKAGTVGTGKGGGMSQDLEM